MAFPALVNCVYKKAISTCSITEPFQSCGLGVAAQAHESSTWEVEAREAASSESSSVT